MKFSLSFMVAVIVSIFSLSHTLSASTDSQTKFSLLGEDSNKNKVRDDVEKSITLKIDSKSELYKAYLNYAQSLQEIFNIYPEISLIKKTSSINDSDYKCVLLLDKDIQRRSLLLNQILKETFNTKERNVVLRWYNENESMTGHEYIVNQKLDKSVLCRNF